MLEQGPLKIALPGGEMILNSESRNKKHSKPSGGMLKFSLYMADWRPNSIEALTNLKRICSKHLEDRCRIVLFDLEKKPELAKKMEIVATPTLVKAFPLPLRRVTGILSNPEWVLEKLGLSPMVKSGMKVTH